MNKRILAVVAAAALLILTGCTAPMSAKDSCRQYKDLMASFSAPGAAVSMDRANVTGQFTDLASKAPDSLKADMTTVAHWLRVAISDRNQAEADRLNPEYQKAERRVRDTCSNAA